MVYVAPGRFTLGTSKAEVDAWVKVHPKSTQEWSADEQPQCRVGLGGYWIGRTEVTNTQYLRFMQATTHHAPLEWKGGQIPPGLESFPVVDVFWDDARAYCEWAGGCLPTELQWEKAARGTDGRVFPWGNQWDSKRYRGFDPNGPAPVGSHPADRSPYGCLDMVGNVGEWCADRYSETAYQRYAKGDLTPPPTGELRVLRGGSWNLESPHDFRCAWRGWGHSPDNCSTTWGFRCARGLP